MVFLELEPVFVVPKFIIYNVKIFNGYDADLEQIEKFMLLKLKFLEKKQKVCFLFVFDFVFSFRLVRQTIIINGQQEEFNLVEELKWYERTSGVKIGGDGYLFRCVQKNGKWIKGKRLGEDAIRGCYKYMVETTGLEIPADRKITCLFSIFLSLCCFVFFFFNFKIIQEDALVRV